MADPTSTAKNSLSFPSPPPFYKYFTDENVALLKTLKDSHSAQTTRDPAGGDAVAQLRSLKENNDLPPDLQFLIPPDPPSTGTYRSFGDTYFVEEKLPNLEDAGIEQVYPADALSNSLNPAQYLRNIAGSLLLSFVELVGVLSIAPDQYHSKIEDLQTLFLNFHDLLNKYRPHQARESLILLMEEQLEKSRAETAQLQLMNKKVQDVLKGLGDLVNPKVISTNGISSQLQNSSSRDGIVWKALDLEFQDS
ncbi:MAG: Mediator of RNA polymerase II transcription subunit 7 [Trizodia sp. TS-e1964]|nr:MAG: Mediator of RNA polymerase II transcription subunit 7 [Trizodia sp. TS-e1964]